MSPVWCTGNDASCRYHEGYMTMRQPGLHRLVEWQSDTGDTEGPRKRRSGLLDHKLFFDSA